MFKLNSDDIALLYDKLVILPSDKNEETESKNEKAQSESEIPITEITTQNQEDKEQPQSSKVNLEEDNSEKPQKEIIHPFIVLTTSSIKDNLTDEASNFRKIIQALKIGHVIKYIQSVESIDLSVQKYKCIWCIGLPVDAESKLKAMQYENILFSPNMETLKNKEEKIAMFSPLKDFASTNMGLLSKL
ncbi:MAG: hypothetical protein KJP21_00475 [Bacteroidia bacterium]|nr:hypothetical protein [Bacteroidia bacterium]NNJ55366.1 hypothetical protein [Bacteroidia bacterium]